MTDVSSILLTCLVVFVVKSNGDTAPSTCASRTSVIDKNSFRGSALETKLNECADLYMQYSYVYHEIYYYFRRDDVALENIGDEFREFFFNEIRMAELVRDFIDDRGGCVSIPAIPAPPNIDWCVDESLLYAINATTEICGCLNTASDLARTADDQSALEFIGRMAMERVGINKKMGRHYKSGVRALTDFDEWIFQILNDWNIPGQDGTG
ncbi:unnamed protein product [Owenia fusiformis]|uniref:ferroxidase n=1 Tax=Owenia fusiformis TaxID=6347 RepID=A0A8J1TDH2_OWEFU|nr:unnamed protein product [Owenia fusiformis]